MGLKMEESNIVEKINKKEDYSNIVPIWKFVLLSIFSFPFYHYYWIYKNWDNIKRSFNSYEKISPILRTLGTFLIPIFGYFLIYKQFKIIRIEANKINSNYFRINLLVILVLFFLVDSLGWKEFPYNLLVVFNFLPFIFIQNELNIIWKKLRKYPIATRTLSFDEKLLLVLGFFSWTILTLYISVKIQ